jgi:YHS domain-containing protein
MLTTIAISAVLFGQAQQVTCPVMGSPVAQNSKVVEYAGAKFSFCCPGCESNFAQSPSKFLESTKAKTVAGVFLFDPVSRQRLEIHKAVSTADFKGIRYPFSTSENRSKFLSSPDRFAKRPSKEALYCPVGKEVVKSYSKASDYVDHNGIRWFMCCDGCGGPFEQDPTKYLVPGIEQYVHIPNVVSSSDQTIKATTIIPKLSPRNVESSSIQTKVTFGKYQAELRLPEDGLFAGEEIDVEFRVVDTTQQDKVEAGFKGVGAIEATAVMIMPSMLGMPEARPKVHREGVPGDYGIELYFPHGGEYQINLALSIPGEEIKKIAFMVDVKDERPTTSSKSQPYQLKVVDWPKNARAGVPTNLKLRVIDTKTGKTQTSFDEAHTKFFHLLLASKDLNWFLHEHPEMAPDGTWSIPITFPAGTEYWVYGDVAPTGKGSRVLISSVKIAGKKPTWNTKLALTTQGTDGNLKGLLSTLEPIEIGRKATIQVKLFDVKSGMAVGDTIKWLGAAGHMMIFHKDGNTVVHSHPAEDAENEALVKKGIVRFTGRFPKAGVYKVYAQFDWQGKVRTLPFAIEVKK